MGQYGMIEGDNINIVDINDPDGKDGLIAEMKVMSPIDRTWDVMTDYSSLPEFIPNLKVSRVIEKKGDEIILYQEGVTGIMMFKFRIGVTVKIVEHHHQSIEFTKVDGDFEIFEGEWRVVPLTYDETLIIFTLKAKPKFYAPNWVIRSIMKRDIPLGMKALRERIEK